MCIYGDVYISYEYTLCYEYDMKMNIIYYATEYKYMIIIQYTW